jgi:hypothetical protein
MRLKTVPPTLMFLGSTLACVMALHARASVSACFDGCHLSHTFSNFQTLSIPTNRPKRRILSLRRSETPDGVRLTLTSDAPLDDYRSYVEGERFFVHIPQAALVRTHHNPEGRGFADLRIEQRDDDLFLSFRLQQGATVNIKQFFHQLHVIFYTNEPKNSRTSAKAVKLS